MCSSLQRRRGLAERMAQIQITLDRASCRPESLTDGARVLLSTINELIDRMYLVLDRRWSELDPLDEQAREMARIGLCDDLQDVVRDIGATLIPVLESAIPEAIPIEMEPVVQRLAAGAAPDWHLTAILFGSHKHNYSIQRADNPLKRWTSLLGLPESELSGEDVTQDFLLLSLPRTDRQSGTLHSVLLGHELGHLRDWYHGITRGLDIPEQDSFFDPDGQLSLEGSRQRQVYNQIALRWTAEVVADMYACLHLGPASLFSLAELAGGLAPMHVDHLTHPGTDRRINLIMRWLDNMGFPVNKKNGNQVDKKNGNQEDLAALLGSVSDATARALARPVEIESLAGDDLPGRLAWDWLRSEADGIWTRVTSSEKEAEPLDPKAWEEEVGSAVESMSAGLTAGERHVGNTVMPADVRYLMNAGWLTKLSHLGSVGSMVEADVADVRELGRAAQVVDDLLLKSIEIAEYRRSHQWR